MTLLIVDDEINIREGLRDTVDWSSIGIQNVMTAKNGLEAKQILWKTVPDIILTDIRMPGMDGLELSEYVLHLFPKVKIFLISGYTDFYYAKQAISIGIKEYFVKPVIIDDLLQKISAAVQEIENERQLSSRRYDKNRSANNNILRLLLEGNLSQSEASDLVHSAGYPWKGLFLTAIVIDYSENEDPNSSSAIVQNDIEQYLLKEYPDNSFCLVRSPHSIICFINLNSSEELPTTIEKISNDLSLLNQRHGILISAAFSSLYSAWSFQKALLEAEKIQKYHFFVGLGTVLSAGQFTNREFEKPVNPITVERELKASIHTADIETCLDYMQPLFESYRFSNIESIETIKDYCLQLITILTESIQQDKSEISILKLGYMQYAKTFTTVEEYIQQVQEYYCSIFDILKHNQPSKGNRIVTQAKNYIESNYDQPLSVERIAKAVDRNPNYLCHIFIQSEGISITEYINKTRISKAKELLRNTFLMTYEIAEKTGFNDYRYFSQIFKKYTGITPSSYRNKQHS